jgi:hypothetical protein
MKRLMIATLFATLPAAAQAQDDSHYCRTGTLGLVNANKLELALAAIGKIADSCKPGDTIRIPANVSFAVETVCDFDKAIVSFDNEVYCVVRKPRLVR